MSEETANAATLTPATATPEADASKPESILTVATGGDSTKDQGPTEGKASDQKDAPKSADEAEKKDADGDKKDAPTGAPEKYELKAPEGMVLDEALIAKAEPIFKELGLTNEGAQKLADLYAGAQAEFTTQIQEAWATQNQEWLAELKSTDKGWGTSYTENVKDVQSAVAWIGNAVPGFQAEIERLGIQNNPALARGFAAIGKAMRDDTVPKATTSVEKAGNTFLPGSTRT